MVSLQSLLNSVNSILIKEKIKKEESLRRGEEFNMFEVCGVAHYEVMHSAIISSFLNPKASHGQNDKYLRLLLEVIGDEISMETSSATIYTEYSMSDGRIDILIEDNKGNGIIIENKIYANDMNEQLARYAKFAWHKYGNGKYAIYYLTLDGHEASEQSAKDVRYNTISYRNDILLWIENCIKESATMPLIRETFIQYRNHIKQLTNLDMGTGNKEELIKRMADNAEAVAAICNAQEEYKQYVYYTYVAPRFNEFAQEHSLIYKDCNLFKSGEKGFYFHKKEWKTAAIFIYTEKIYGERDFYWGISNFDEQLKVEKNKLVCLSSPPTDGWPYGWEYLSKYRNWDMNTMVAMVNGEYVAYIEELVLKALDEIEKKQLPMP